MNSKAQIIETESVTIFAVRRAGKNAGGIFGERSLNVIEE